MCFNAIVFVLVTEIAWAHLPRELGGSGTTGSVVPAPGVAHDSVSAIVER